MIQQVTITNETQPITSDWLHNFFSHLFLIKAIPKFPLHKIRSSLLLPDALEKNLVTPLIANYKLIENSLHIPHHSKQLGTIHML